MTRVAPSVLLMAARWAFTTQQAAPRDVLSAIVINADAVRNNPQVCRDVKRLLAEEWLPEWNYQLGPLRDTALRLLAAEEAA